MLWCVVCVVVVVVLLVVVVCVCVCWCCVVCVVVVVVLLLVVVCVCVCCGTLKKRENPHHAHMCFNMCAWCRYTRDILNLHTEGVLYIHTGEQGVIVSSAYQNLPTYGYHVIQRFTKETNGSSPFSV